MGGLVRLINTRTLGPEEIQREAVKVYDLMKMVEMAAERRRYELVLQHLLGVYNVRPVEYSLMSQLTLMTPTARLLQLNDESLALYRTSIQDTALYTCASGFSEDFGRNSYTYYVEVLEPRGHFLQVEGNQHDYEDYKTKVIKEYNETLKKFWKHDYAFLYNTAFMIYEGGESDCSACSGKEGLKKRDIQLRIYNTKVTYKMSTKERFKGKFKFYKVKG